MIEHSPSNKMGLLMNYSKKRIFQSIDAANFNEIKLLKESYQQLKFKLGRIPDLMDFEEYGSIDALRFIDKAGSYHKFLDKYEPDYLVKFDGDKELMLEFLSKKFASGKRAHELLMLRRMLHYHNHLMESLREELEENYVHNNIGRRKNWQAFQTKLNQ